MGNCTNKDNKDNSETNTYVIDIIHVNSMLKVHNKRSKLHFHENSKNDKYITIDEFPDKHFSYTIIEKDSLVMSKNNNIDTSTIIFYTPQDVDGGNLIIYDYSGRKVVAGICMPRYNIGKCVIFPSSVYHNYDIVLRGARISYILA